jgi:serine/threonine-protein kinase
MLPGYRIGDEVGRGAVGVVYEARHERLNRLVAVKRLSQAISGNPAVRERFETEGQVLAALDHPHIVRVYDSVERHSECLLVMEHLSGGSLWDRFTTVGMSQPQAVAIILATCAAMEHAHAQGVLHRDIKPENLLFDSAGVVKVTDFGVAHLINGDATRALPSGRVIGTPLYMSPEQAQGLPVGPPADVYATGTMLYELLSGRLPFPGSDDVMVALNTRVNEQPTPLLEVAPQVPAAIAEVTMKAIAGDLTERYPSAEEFGVALAAAASATWGYKWLDTIGMTVQLPRSIQAAARTPHVGPGFSSDPVSTETVDRTASDLGGAGTTIDPISGPVMLPEQPHRTAFAKALNTDLGELIDISSLRNALARPVLWYATSAGAAAVAGALLLWAGGTQRSDIADDLSQVRVAGVTVGTDQQITVDLGEPIVVEGLTAYSGGTVELQLNSRGVQLASREASIVAGRAVFDDPSLDNVATGALTARLTATPAPGSPSNTDTATFPVDASNPWYASALGIGTVLFTLLAFTGLDFALRLLRWQRRSRRRMVTVAIPAALVGLGATTVASSVLRIHHGAASTLWTMVMCIGSALSLAMAVSINRLRRKRASLPPGLRMRATR